MNKFIFLDIDGVIATPTYIKEGQWALNPEKQLLLGEILDKTKANIVLSSSWRLSTLEETKEYMVSEDFMFTEYLVGVTIRAYQWLERGTGIHLSIPRGVEIKQWIDTHIHSNNGKDWKRKEVGKDFTYVILDDGKDMLLEQKDYFINTDGEIGLTKEHVEQAIKILNNL